MHGGNEYFDVLVDIINKAQHEIHLHTYTYDNDETGNRITEALVEAVKRGVNVSIVLDAYGSNGFKEEEEKRLKKLGIRIRFFGLLGAQGNWAWGRRLHHKIVVVDRYYSLVGGINISNRYSGHGFDWAWFDMALLVKGHVGQQIARICIKVQRQLFSNSRKTLFPFIEPDEESKKIKIQLKQNDWLRSKNQIASSYANALKNAKEEIIIVNSYFLPGGYFRRLLKKAAKNKDLKVKMLLPSMSDIPFVKNAMTYLYRFLLRNNIEVYEWKPSILHAKVACTDRKWCTVGSYNLNYLSAYASIEFNIDVLDNKFSGEFQKHLNKLLNSSCVQIQKEDFDTKYSLYKKFIYWFSFRLMKLSEGLLISFPGQSFFKKNEYA